MIQSFGDATTEKIWLRERVPKLSPELQRGAQYRICFRWTDAGPADVELIDYHD